MNEAIKHDPMYPQLHALNDAIATLQFTAAQTQALTPAQIATQIRRLDQELATAQRQTSETIAHDRTQYLNQETEAVASALAAAGVPNAHAVATSLSAASQGMSQAAAQAQAGQALQAFQKSIIAENTATMQATVAQIRNETRAKLEAKSEEISARESALSLQLSQQDAGRRLSLQTKLSNLAMDNADRKAIAAQLKAIDRHEQSVLAAAQARDRAEYIAYQRQVEADYSTRVRAQAQTLQTNTQAQMQSRRSQVISQLQNLAPAGLPANLPTATRQELARIQNDFQGRFESDAQHIMGSYGKTKAELDAEYAAAQSGGDAAAMAAAKALVTQGHQRDDLYAKIVQHVQTVTKKLARERGFSVVFVNVNAAPGGYDLTNDVTHAIESLKQ